uniref:NlpC/P60 family protein n=1 Tax=Roseburia faecis TaxID=301302 RepID=UPI0015BA5D32
MHKKIHVKTKNKICAAVLVFVLAGSLTAGACAVPNVYAKTEAEKKRDAYKKKLKAKNSDIANIKDSQSDVKDSITVAAAKMKTLLSKQEQLKSDIKDKQNEVEQANKKLEEAKEEEQNQYDAMKLRIQYLYENSTDNSIWSAILESNGLSDMLNRIEYATDLYKSDRELMTSYQNAVKKVEDWTMQLADEMDSLLALQDKYQTQQGELKTLMAKLEQQKDAYAQQLAEAQKQAQDYKKTISKQEAIIRAQEAAAARANANTYDGGGTGASGGIASDSYLKDPDCNPSQTTDVSGADIVAFAQQFVGNPYVWGGNSLTNGVDCSGFVHQVYAHFGISTPRYSQAFKSVGQPVSYQNIQAGDVVVYPGHVAIYIGNGNIVEAQSTRAGITNSRPVNCHTITAIRRLV